MFKNIFWKCFIWAWQFICQNIADYYFYKGLRIGWNTEAGARLLDKYNIWLDYKFILGD